jgi:double zinc ribbon protein
MARLPFSSRARTQGPDASPAAGAAPVSRRALPPAGVLRRERRTLLRVREDRLRDLGGLMLEMYRRDLFREDLLVERCVELAGLDDRLQELDALLAAASLGRRRPPAARCECGRPIAWGSHFCPDCGRALRDTPAASACAGCGTPLAADARYCATCGRPVDPTQAGGPLPDDWGEA